MRPLLDGLANVDIAVINGPRAVVVAGDEEAAFEVGRRVAALGRRTTRLRTSHAFHSCRMDPMLEAFGRVLETISFWPPRIPVVSNLTGKFFTNEEVTSAEYWVRHVRGAVRFSDGLRAVVDAGATTFLELGPHGVLTPLAQRSVSDAEAAQLTFASALRKDRAEPDMLVRALCTMHARGQLAEVS